MTDNKTTRENVILNAVIDLVRDSDDEVWFGTMTQLRTSILKTVSKDDIVNIPGSASALRVVLNSVVNRLRVRKISVKFGRNHFDKYVRFMSR
jgi:hypothetical protein